MSLIDVPMRKLPSSGGSFSIMHMTPINVIEQQELFFANNCKINPIFEYANYSATLKYKQLHSIPRDEYLALAKKILDSFMEEYGCESNYLESEGDVLS